MFDFNSCTFLFENGRMQIWKLEVGFPSFFFLGQYNLSVQNLKTITKNMHPAK